MKSTMVIVAAALCAAFAHGDGDGFGAVCRAEFRENRPYVFVL